MADEKALNEDEISVDTVVFTYDDGTEEEFEIFTDDLEYDGKKYAILIPCNEEDEDVVITEYNSENEEYTDVTDEKTLNAVYEIFKEKYKNEFDFI